MQLVTPGESGEQGLPELALRSARCRRRGGSAEGLATRRTRARLGGSGGIGVARSGPRASVADADRTRRVRSGARRAALSGGRSLSAAGREHAGAALERCPAAVRRSQKASRRISAPRSPRGHTRAEGESPRAPPRFTAGVACPDHAGQGPQADVAAAPQGYYGRETLLSQAALDSPPLAGRDLDQPHAATPTQHRPSRAV